MTSRTIKTILSRKHRGPKITVLTAYDYPLAVLLDKAGVDVVLVGDSLANVVLGLNSTREVDIDIMIHHAKAVRRGVKNAFLLGDMPYSSCHKGAARAVKDAKRFKKAAGLDAVKIEWFPGCLPVIKKVIAAGVPVMGHVGLTPQIADRLGGFKVQGRDAASAKKIIAQAKELEKIGCFSVLLECVPDRLAGLITKELKVPTISCGAGPLCDGQVLVSHDILGLFDRFRPKFVKQFAEIDQEIIDGVKQYIQEVKERAFPAAQNVFSIADEEWGKILKERA